MKKKNEGEAARFAVVIEEGQSGDKTIVRFRGDIALRPEMQCHAAQSVTKLKAKYSASCRMTRWIALTKEYSALGSEMINLAA